MALEFNKIDETCSNVYLIDERLCLKNSYEVINTNVETLTANLNNLQIYSNGFNQLYSNFSNNSSRWITAISNYQTLSAGWFSAETTVKTLSSYWQSERSIIYNKIINIVNYYSDPTTTKNNIKDWINNNFLNFYSNNQKLNVDLYLSEDKEFSWSYYRQYYEDCIPPKNTLAGTCDCGTPQRGCNYIYDTGTGQFLSSCANLGAYCVRNVISRESRGADNIKCPNVGNRYITFDYTTSREELDDFDDNLTDGDLLIDRQIARIISISFIKKNNTFIELI